MLAAVSSTAPGYEGLGNYFLGGQKRGAPPASRAGRRNNLQVAAPADDAGRHGAGRASAHPHVEPEADAETQTCGFRTRASCTPRRWTTRRRATSSAATWSSRTARASPWAAAPTASSSAPGCRSSTRCCSAAAKRTTGTATAAASSTCASARCASASRRRGSALRGTRWRAPSATR